jgi:hypothetical protein
MKSSRCPLVACSDVMGSSVTDILGAAEALAPAVIGAAIGSQIPGNRSQSKGGSDSDGSRPLPGRPPGGSSLVPFRKHQRNSRKISLLSRTKTVKNTYLFHSAG